MDSEPKSFLDEIDSPIILSQRCPWKFSITPIRDDPWIILLENSSLTVTEALAIRIEKEGKIVGRRISSKLLIVIFAISLFIGGFFYFDFYLGEYFGLSPPGGHINPIPTEFASQTIENSFFLARILQALTVTLLPIIIPITRWFFPKNNWYAHECLQYKNEEEYIEYEGDYFYFKAIDWEWDLKKLFSFNISIIIGILFLSGFLLGIGIEYILKAVNDSELNNQPLNFRDLNFPLISIGIFISILFFCIIHYGSKLFFYYKLRKQVRLSLKEKIVAIEEYIENRKSSFHCIEVLQRYTKLNLIFVSLKDLPLIPIEHKKEILFAYSALTTVYSLITTVIGLFI